MKRGMVRTAESRFLGVWIPKPLVVLMESAMGDSDRSKFIRAALRERIVRKYPMRGDRDRTGSISGDLGAPHSKDGSIEKYILATGKLRMKASAYFQ